jgi:hypothetical protein
LKFEHLVEINGPSNPLEAPLTREELWFGLLCRAEDPRAFLPGLEACEVLARTDNTLTRRLSFGQAVIEDRVSFEALSWMRFESDATREHAGGSLTITIEEPGEGALFLRFAYATSLSEDDGGVPYAEFVKSAYRESDIDTVRVIRMIAASSRIQ